MANFWESIAAADRYHKVEDFETTAYRLAADQVIYHSDRASRTAYAMVERYEAAFARALEAVGIGLKVNRQLRYATALPLHGRAGMATVDETLFALVLRKLYDERARLGQMSERGEVPVDLVELKLKYELMTCREFPQKGGLDRLLRVMKRWGLARVADDGVEFSEYGDQPYMVAIRPAIVDVLGETALARLARWNEAGANATAEKPATTDGEPDDDAMDAGDGGEEQ